MPETNVLSLFIKKTTQNKSSVLNKGQLKQDVNKMFLRSKKIAMISKLAWGLY